MVKEWVREPDIDWKIYHVIAAAKGCCPRCRISEETNYEEDIIDTSIQRLISLRIIRAIEEGYRVVSIEEYMIDSQIRYGRSSPIIIENGIIRERRPDE